MTPLSAFKAFLRWLLSRSALSGGPFSRPSSGAGQKQTLGAVLMGMACILSAGYGLDDKSIERGGFVRASRNADARGQFVGPGVSAEITVVVVTYNSASYVSPLIDDLRIGALDHAMRVVVVDNRSSDDTVGVVRAHGDVILFESLDNGGYARGINAGLAHAHPSDAVLILNPDIQVGREAVRRLLAAADADGIGAVVPLVLKPDGTPFRSLRREPSLTRAVGDAFFGGKVSGRPGFTSETDARPMSYVEPHDIDWATGAALLVPAAVIHEVGSWNEEFFLYSEETDYFRRIRDSGYRVRFEPSAVVVHEGRGSGSSPEHATLMAVNRIRYIELHHGRAYSLLFRAVVALAEGLRSYDSNHRRTLGYVLNRQRWQELPHYEPTPNREASHEALRDAALLGDRRADNTAS